MKIKEGKKYKARMNPDWRNVKSFYIPLEIRQSLADELEFEVEGARGEANLRVIHSNPRLSGWFGGEPLFVLL